MRSQTTGFYARLIWCAGGAGVLQPSLRSGRQEIRALSSLHQISSPVPRAPVIFYRRRGNRLFCSRDWVHKCTQVGENGVCVCVCGQSGSTRRSGPDLNKHLHPRTRVNQSPEYSGDLQVGVISCAMLDATTRGRS